MSYTVFLVLLFLLAAAYWAWSLVTTKPERTLYAVCLLWCFFPKAARVIYFAPGADDWPEGITVYTALEAVAFVGVGVALLKHREHRSELATRPLRRFAYLLAATGVLSIVLPSLLQQFPDQLAAASFWTFVSETIEPQWRLIGASSLVYGAIFTLGCIEFLRTLKKIEPILFIMVLCGLELALEAILLFNLHLAPGLEKWEVRTHRFNSLTLNTYDMVGLVSILNIGALLYFAAARKKARLLLLLPVLLWAVLITFQRAPLIGIAVELLLAAWLLRQRWRLYALSAAALAFLAISLANVPALDLVAATLGQDIRPEYLSPETGYVRVGLNLRGLDSLIFVFPAGAGPEMLRYAMGTAAPETLRMLNTPESLATYIEVSDGAYFTGPHNAVIEFIGDNGALGLIAATGFGFLVLRNFIRWLALPIPTTGEARSLMLLQVFTYSILLGIGAFVQFEATMLPHAFTAMLLYFTFLPFVRGVIDDQGYSGQPVAAHA